MEHGVVYAASGDGAFSLTSVDANAAVIKKAKLKGSQIVMRAQMDYEAAHSAEAGGQQAFENSTGVVVRNMWESIRKRVELVTLYGQVQLGTCMTGTTTTVLKVRTAEWAEGIWAGMEGATIEVLASGLGSSRASRKISSVQIATQTVTVATAITGATKTDKIYFKSQYSSAHKAAQGLHSILSGPTTIHGITTASYSTWKPNTYAVSGNLSLTHIQKAVAKAVGKGLDSDVTLYINPKSWANLMNDQAALRRYDVSQNAGQYIVGAEELVFHSQNGKITIKAHPYVWEGYAYMISPSLFKRIGATDVTFDRAAMGGVSRSSSYFIELQSKAGFELRCYSHQALFCEAPAKTVLLTGITS